MKVSELTEQIKKILESDFSHIAVEGEISNYRPASSGHIYFSLKDEKALISAVLFRGQATKLPFIPRDGQKVRAFGRISVYPPRGNYQIICQSLLPAGDGELLQIIEERKQRLAQEGLFDESRKKALPLFPKTIVLVTSPTGAALRDMLNVLERRNDRVHIRILPCPVQGEGAAEEIADQIRRANSYRLGDVIILSRGGGSLEDLMPFSEECVLRAIGDSDIPVISGVGHEIDFTLSDFAADYRAPTPSAAAETVSLQAEEVEQMILRIKHMMRDEILSRLERMRLLLSPFMQEGLEENFYRYLEPLLLRLDDSKEELVRNMTEHINERRHRLELIRGELHNNSPHGLLERGFARVTHPDGRTVSSYRELAVEDRVNITLWEGEAEAQIRKLKSPRSQNDL